MTFKSICRTLLALALSTGLTLTGGQPDGRHRRSGPRPGYGGAGGLAQAPTTGDAR